MKYVIYSPSTPNFDMQLLSSDNWMLTWVRGMTTLSKFYLNIHIIVYRLGFLGETVSSKFYPLHIYSQFQETCATNFEKYVIDT